MNGIFVAITVMNWTFASSGKGAGLPNTASGAGHERDFPHGRQNLRHETRLSDSKAVQLLIYLLMAILQNITNLNGLYRMALRLGGTLSRFASFVSKHSRLESGHDVNGLSTLSRGCVRSRYLLPDGTGSWGGEFMCRRHADIGL